MTLDWIPPINVKPPMDDAVFVKLTPMGKPRMTQRDKWAKRPAVLRYREFCDELRASLPFYELPPYLELTFFIPMPKSWSKTKQAEKVGTPHDSKPDIDNLAKAFMDAFKTEDKHVFYLKVGKYWSETGGIAIYGDRSRPAGVAS